MANIAITEVIFRDDLYPRINKDSAMVQRYAEILDVLPPIEVNQKNELIDGWHRWTAHRKIEADNIEVIVTETKSDLHLLALAIKRNSDHGWQLDEDSKKKNAIRLYAAGTGMSKEEIADVLSVTKRSVTGYLTDIEKQLREERKDKIFNMWLASYTQADIADTVDLARSAVSEEIATIVEKGNASIFDNSRDFPQDPDFTPPLYNIWSFSKKTNKTKHFGNSEERIVDNLLYLYTEPYDIVFDPFAGGGGTVDVCRHRLRRYWVSDRLPIVERESDIRKHDITEGLPPLARNWSEVSLTYLDPPYWKQAEGQYSNDPTDLANMSLEEFTKTVVKLIKDIARKQSKGAIALLIQPTQWNAPDRNAADHIIDIVSAVNVKGLRLAHRVSCPYSTEQYNAQQVTWAKENKDMLILTRELIIWKINNE